MARRFPIGISDFKLLREGGYVYVDKSALIRDVVDSPAHVLLLPRPRRFGKTLAQVPRVHTTALRSTHVRTSG